MGESRENVRFWSIVAIAAMAVFLLHSLWFGQSITLYIAVLLLCAAIVVRYPVIGLYMTVILTMWFERHYTLQPIVFSDHIYKIYPLDFILLFTGVGALFRVLARELHWKWNKRFDTPILLFAGAAVFGLVPALIGQIDFTSAGATFKNYIVYGVVYVFTVLLLRAKEDWREFMRYFAIGGLGLFFFLGYGILAGEGLWSEFTPLSTPGVRLIAGTHAFYLTLFGFWVLAHSLWRLRDERDALSHWLSRSSSILLALASVGIAVSLVRHIWVALFALVVMWAFMLPKEETILFRQIAAKGVVFGFLAIGLYALIVFSFSGRMPSSVTGTAYVFTERLNLVNVFLRGDPSFDYRLASWAGGLRLWAAHPVFGAGLGVVVHGYFEVTPFEIEARAMHNDYLGIVVQLGLLGVAAVGYWLYQLFGALRRLIRVRSHDAFETRFLFMWGSAAVLFLIVFSISIYWDINLFVIWWWMTLAAVRWLWVHRRRPFPGFLSSPRSNHTPAP